MATFDSCYEVAAPKLQGCSMPTEVQTFQTMKKKLTSLQVKHPTVSHFLAMDSLSDPENSL